MKLLNFFTFIFLIVSAANVSAYVGVQCGPGTTPVQVPGGWQCTTARAGDPQIVFPEKTKLAGAWGQYECRLRPEFQQGYETPEQLDVDDYEDEESEVYY